MSFESSERLSGGAKALMAARFLVDSRKDIELFGMYGAGNLGDEAMEYAGHAVLPKGRTVSSLVGRLTSFERIAQSRRRRHFVFGGGTLIHGGDAVAGNGWLDIAEHRQRQGSALAFFGTGIAFKPHQIADRSDDFRRWARVLERSAKVAVRGPMSQATAREMGVEAECFGDACFSLFDPKRVRSEREAHVLAVNFGECLGDQTHYEAINARMIASLPRHYHFLVFIVVAHDRAPTQRILAASGVTPDRYTIVEEFWNPDAYIDRVSQCRAFIGVKLHAAGLALLAGVPTLLFQYREKCRDFFSVLELEEGLLDVTADADEVCRRVDILLAHPGRFSNVPKIMDMKAHQLRMVSEYFAAA